MRSRAAVINLWFASEVLPMPLLIVDYLSSASFFIQKFIEYPDVTAVWQVKDDYTEC